MKISKLTLIMLSLLSIHVSSESLDCVPVVMAGYDVVHYFLTQDSECDAKKGFPRYSYNLDSTDYWGDSRTYQFWFSSQSNLDIFSSDPWKYAPKYGGFCSYGTCCELDSGNGGGWPWNGTWFGPPAGPDSSRCGFRVYNGSLYFNIWNSYDNTFFNHRDTYIPAADTRWIGWFGSLNAGVFNWGCFSTQGWNYMDCVYSPLAKAPLAIDVEENNFQRCDNVPTTDTTQDSDDSDENGSSDSSESSDDRDDSDESSDESSSDSSERSESSGSSSILSSKMFDWIIAIIIIVVGIIIGVLLCKRFSKRKVRSKRQFIQLKEEIDRDDKEKEIEMNDNIAPSADQSENIHDQILEAANPNNEGVVVTAAVV